MRYRRIAVAAGLALLLPALASAQSDPGGRFRLGINAGTQTSRNTVSQSFTVTKLFEPASITSTVGEKGGILADIGLVARIKGPIGVGFAASFLTHDANADVTGRIPHPFVFNQPRTIQGSERVHHTEAASHIQAVVHLPGRRVDVLASVGPSIVNISHTLITDVSYGDVYPFDTATYGAADKKRVSTTAIGYSVGADVTWKFARRVGLGGLIRFTQANATVSTTNNPSVRLEAGGLQAGAGLRFPF